MEWSTGLKECVLPALDRQVSTELQLEEEVPLLATIHGISSKPHRLKMPPFAALSNDIFGKARNHRASSHDIGDGCENGVYLHQSSKKLFPCSQYNPVIRWGLHHREHGHGINVLGLCYNVFQEFHVQFFDATADAASALDWIHAAEAVHYILFWLKLSIASLPISGFFFSMGCNN